MDCMELDNFSNPFTVSTNASTITVTSHELHDISNYRQLDSLFNSSFMRTKKKKGKRQSCALLARC